MRQTDHQGGGNPSAGLLPGRGSLSSRTGERQPPPAAPAARRLEGRSVCPSWHPGDAQGPAGRRPRSRGTSPGFRREAWVLTLMLLREDGAQSGHHLTFAPGPQGPGGQNADWWTECWERAFTKKHYSEVGGWVPRRPGLTAPMTP